MADKSNNNDRSDYPVEPYNDNALLSNMAYGEQGPEGNHLRDYFKVIIRRRRVILVFFVSVVIIVTAASLMMTPEYESTVTIKIDKESPLVVDFSGLQIEKLSSDYYETQYKILSSRNLAKRVISSLDLDKTADFMPQGGNFSIKNSVLQLSSLLFPKKKAQTSDDHVAGVISGQLTAERDVKTSHIDKFISRLDVTPLKDSRLVSVSYRSTSPELAQKVANQLADSYIDLDIESKLDASKNVGRFLEDQIKTVRSKVENSERALNDYSSENEMIYLDDSKDKQSLLLKRLSELSSSLNEATADRIQKEAVYKEALESGGRHPVFNENTVIEQLKKDYANLESEYFNLLTVYTPDYPKMKSLKSQLNALETRQTKLKNDIMMSIQADYKAALKRENYLDEAVKAQKRDILAFQQKSVPYQILKRDVDANNQLHENLLQRQKEVDVAATQTNTNIQVLDRAEYPRLPSKPNVPRNAVLAIIVGLMGGVGLAFFMEYFDDTVKDTVDIERITRLPAFGVIPHYKEGIGNTAVPLIGHSLNGDPIAEAFRGVGAFILLSSSGKRPRSILITSPNEREGKTTVCVNTAIALSETAGNGIIIDADLRRPKLHRSFGVDNSAGLTTYLSNKGLISSDGIIKKTSTAGLSIMTSGPSYPNPSELMTTEKLKNLLNALYPKFDFVIIDSAPVTRINECAYLSSLVDGTVLVVKAGQTQTNSVEQSKRILRNVNAKVLGVVLNGVRNTELLHGYY